MELLYFGSHNCDTHKYYKIKQTWLNLKLGFYDKYNQKYFLGLVPIDSMIRKSIFSVVKQTWCPHWSLAIPTTLLTSDIVSIFLTSLSIFNGELLPWTLFTFCKHSAEMYTDIKNRCI